MAQLDKQCLFSLPLQVSADGNWMHLLFQSRLQAKKVVQYTPDGDYYNLHTRPQLSKGVEKYVNMLIWEFSIVPYPYYCV